MPIGSIQSALVSAFQDENPETFNEDLIYMRHKERASLHDYFKDVFASLKLQGITYLESRTITDESEFEKYVPKRTKAIEENRMDLIEAKFLLEFEGEKKETSIHLFFPKLVDDFFFYINGNRYFAIYQISDRNFYSTRTGLFLKTLLMPLGLQFRKSEFETLEGTHYEGKEYVLDFFKTKFQNFDALKNMFYYFFIKFGVTEAIDMIFENTEDFTKVALVDDADEIEGYETIELRKDLFIKFYSNPGQNEQNYINLVATLVAALKGIRKTSITDNEDYWKRKILNSPTAKLTKADKALISLERVLDERTKRNLKEVTDPAYKQDVYGLIRWMTYNFENLYNIDTVDIYNRRLRLYEYMLYPLLIKFSDASYRILNSRNLDLKRLETVFSNIGPMFIIKRLITNELFRYNNATSSLELFSAALRWSSRGSQSLGSSGGSITIKYRAVHPSYLGVVSLNAASASDPGMTGTLVPMSKNVDTMFFEPDAPQDIYSHSVDAMLGVE
jgi:hypothetical protein